MIPGVIGDKSVKIGKITLMFTDGFYAGYSEDTNSSTTPSGG